MEIEESASLALYAAAVGIALLAAIQLLTRTPVTFAYRAAGGFFVVFGLIEAANAVALAVPAIAIWIVIPSGILLPALAPLVWLYVEDLVAETVRTWRKRDLWHFLPSLVQAGLTVAFFLLPGDDQRVLFGASVGPVSPAADAVGVTLALTSIAWAIQLIVYCGLILRRLFGLRARLWRVFASTETRELGWLTILTVVALVNVGLTALYNIGGVNMVGIEPMFSAGAVVFALVLAAWSVRQTPAFQTDARTGMRTVVAEEASGVKYERSLLSDERLDQIANQIAIAFDRDRLHLNPSLSLPMLSRHIRVNDNAISQTLTRKLGTSFFEYVNRRRIDDAMVRLIDSDEPIMSVAYEVGFNSRSAFYKAFRAVTDRTPTEFRHTQSVHAAGEAEPL